jgi:hypothetical protein
MKKRIGPMLRNPIFWAIAVIVGTVIALLAILMVGLSVLEEDACANQLLDESVSPDRQMKAVVFVRDCGATTDFSTQVSIIPRTEKLSKAAGNAFSSDTNHGAAPSGPGYGPAIKVQWQSPTELVISHHPAARVFRIEPVVGNIKVRAVKSQ